MKIANTVLSMILLILSCLPCADAADDSTGLHEMEEIAGNHTNHSDEQHTDLCSPFCICNCCGVQVLNFSPTFSFNIIEVQAFNTSKLEITYKSQLASMFSGSIWQPPQIV